MLIIEKELAFLFWLVELTAVENIAVILYNKIKWTISSAVEHCIHIAGVGGSNPPSSTE